MIKGKKVSLREVTRDDFRLLYSWINNPKVRSFWYGRDKPRTMTWIKNHFTPIFSGKSESSCWVIEVKGKPIGFMYNTPLKDDDGQFLGRIELDILIGKPDEWGKGYGTNALKTMINYAFKIQKAERVFIIPRVSNKRAIYLYQKLVLKKRVSCVILKNLRASISTV